ncbi:longitudinals lacking protein, isoforms H/M/V [Amyelois transitella]|uniref:longitudinals lacking protein, isoforms H/M/V n=1 Tax=Amyelois transitella TaxID=680683 RepID=UPI0029902D52|nr:longitudinals lacking protein, isoforms H/M/V [Amyelois transitella]
MAKPHFTLSWDSFQNNMCNGLGTLQQNEEFVDMTLAADGHFVKVHQIVLSLASPYIKDLIKSAQCQKPVIFLNKISFHTLCSILEYIYTGQAVVAREHIYEVIEAAKALHIKGLKEMVCNYKEILSNVKTPGCASGSQNATETFKKRNSENSDHEAMDNSIEFCDTGSTEVTERTNDVTNSESQTSKRKENRVQKAVENKNPTKPVGLPNTAQVQYSISNQGNLQVILNRFIYCLRYTGKDGYRMWRCLDYGTNKCRAVVSTKDDAILKRTSVHIHPFHDKQIAKKVRDNAIFSMISEAAERNDIKKPKKVFKCTLKKY